jgi:hypothetical protein
MGSAERIRSIPKNESIPEGQRLGTFIKEAMAQYEPIREFIETKFAGRNDILAQALDKIGDLPARGFCRSLDRGKMKRYTNGIRSAMILWSVAAPLFANEPANSAPTHEPIVAAQMLDSTPGTLPVSAPAGQVETGAEDDPGDGQNNPPDQPNTPDPDSEEGDDDDEEEDEEEEDPLVEKIRDMNELLCEKFGVDSEDGSLANLPDAQRRACRILFADLLNETGNNIAEKWQDDSFQEQLREACNMEDEAGEGFGPLSFLQEDDSSHEGDEVYELKGYLGMLIFVRDDELKAAVSDIRGHIEDTNVLYQFDILECHHFFSEWLTKLVEDPLKLTTLDAESISMMQRLGIESIITDLVTTIAEHPPADRSDLIRTTATAIVGSENIREALESILKSRWSMAEIAEKMYPFAAAESQHEQGEHVPLDIPKSLT